MTRHFRILAALGFVVGLLLSAAPSHAAVVNMCRAAATATSPGPGQWATVAGTRYTLNNIGCARIASGDVAEATSQGFIVQPQIFAAVATLSAAGTLQLPAGAYIDRIIIQETSGASITGGLKIGTASGGTQVGTGLVCGSGCLVWVPDVSLSTRIFANTAPQTLFIDAVSSWNSARANVTIMYGFW